MVLHLLPPWRVNTTLDSARPRSHLTAFPRDVEKGTRFMVYHVLPRRRLDDHAPHLVLLRPLMCTLCPVCVSYRSERQAPLDEWSGTEGVGE